MKCSKLWTQYALLNYQQLYPYEPAGTYLVWWQRWSSESVKKIRKVPPFSGINTTGLAHFDWAGSAKQPKAFCLCAFEAPLEIVYGAIGLFANWARYFFQLNYMLWWLNDSMTSTPELLVHRQIFYNVLYYPLIIYQKKFSLTHHLVTTRVWFQGCRLEGVAALAQGHVWSWRAAIEAISN